MRPLPQNGNDAGRMELGDGSVIAVIGGGPSGAFFALELLRKARPQGKSLRVVIFERRKSAVAPLPNPCGCWHGCNYCAGGISPRLYDVLVERGLRLPDDVIQSKVDSVTIQGFWKNIEVEVPPERRMLSVFRGSRPTGTSHRVHGLDTFLLESALAEGAELISGDVIEVHRSGRGRPVIRYLEGTAELEMEADFCAFACGMNDQPGVGRKKDLLLDSARAMMPGFEPPRTRKTLIFELAARPAIPPGLRNSIYFVEYGSKAIPVEMCSLLAKRDCITVVVIGEAVDRAHTGAQTHELIQGFLRLPHIRNLISPVLSLEPMCVCSPKMVIGLARNAVADRVSVVGDMATSRLYKDGILSAHRTASGLAEAIITHGVDRGSLIRGYGPTLREFRRNNRYASLVFFLHRVFFSSSVLSRVLYQSVITERKTTPAPRRRLEQILWKIASGDDEYEEIFQSMMKPGTLVDVLVGGALITLRNHLTEMLFGLRWEGFGRFTTGVSLERLEEKRAEFKRLISKAQINLPDQLEFERMYTIKISAPKELILAQLETYGETDRQYLRPRWLDVRRISGNPHEPGCVIEYRVLSSRLTFHLKLDRVFEGHLAVYRVVDGFARNGVLLFEIEPGPNGICLLSIYVAFNFPVGSGGLSRLGWALFKRIFPSFVHDVLWNHSLCQLRDVVEREVSAQLRLETSPGHPFSAPGHGFCAHPQPT